MSLKVYTVSRMMSLKEVFYFLTTISLAFPTPYRYLIETGDDQSKSGLDNDCVDKDGKVKEMFHIRIDKCNTCTCIDGRASNKGSRRFHNHGKGWGLHIVGLDF